MRRLTIASKMKQSFGHGENAECQFHSVVNDLQSARRGAADRAGRSHAARFRRSTMFETARTWANGVAADQAECT